MKTVTIIHSENTPMGDIAELILDRSIEPVIGMILMDEDSRTWEVTGTLHNVNRTTSDKNTVLWTFQCKRVNTDDPIHPGEFKLIH